MNTPDLLPYLQGGDGAVEHVALAATLSGNYGVCRGFELLEHDAIPGSTPRKMSRSSSATGTSTSRPISRFGRRRTCASCASKTTRRFRQPTRPRGRECALAPRTSGCRSATSRLTPAGRDTTCRHSKTYLSDGPASNGAGSGCVWIPTAIRAAVPLPGVGTHAMNVSLPSGRHRESRGCREENSSMKLFRLQGRHHLSAPRQERLPIAIMMASAISQG